MGDRVESQWPAFQPLRPRGPAGSAAPGGSVQRRLRFAPWALTLPLTCAAPAAPTPPVSSLLTRPCLPLHVCPVSPLPYSPSSGRSPSSSPVPPSGSIKTRPVSPVRVPLPIYPPAPRLASWPVSSAPLLNLLAAPSTCLQGRRASYPARLGGVSVGTCPWATPRVLSLLPRLPRRAGNRAQGRAGAEGGSTWPVSRQGKGVAGRVSWHGEGTRGETGGTDFGASRQNRTGRGKGTSLGGHLSCAGPFARHSV